MEEELSWGGNVGMELLAALCHHVNSVCGNKANIREAERGVERGEIDGIASVSPSVPKICPVFYPS